MLIQFRVENYRSLRDEQRLSLTAAEGDASVNGALIRISGLESALLPAVALYGANASGKTNVLRALAFMRAAVAQSYRAWEPEGGVPQEPFALSSREDDPSLFEVNIVIDAVRYRYGFVVSSTRIEEEWLHAWPNAKKQKWFQRTADHFEFGRRLDGDNETIRGLTRPNSLFLSVAAQNNHAALTPIFSWFQRLGFYFSRARPTLSPVFYSRMFEEIVGRPQSLFGGSDASNLQRDRESIVRLLQEADTGIVDLKLDREERDSDDGRRARRVSVFLQHKTSDPERSWLPLEVESAGTVTLLELAARLVPVLRTGGILCVDELEASLHPMLAVRLLQLFADPARNPGHAQLVFTTHDSNLLGTILGESPLRRDQVWFTEKDAGGGTHLYPLTDFHPRKAENLERGYLQGRYGAVPFLGDLVAGTAASSRK